VFSRLGLAVLAAVSGALLGCGGDGGDGGGGLVYSTLDLTAANAETVAHATAASVFAFGGATSAVPLSGGSGIVAQGGSARALGFGMSTGPAAWLPQRVVAALTNAFQPGSALGGSLRSRPQAVTVLPPESCGVAGTMSMTFNDQDGNGELSLGDVFTMAFSNCQDSATEVLNGSAAVSVTRIGATLLPSFGAQMRLTQLSQEASDGRHGLTVDGDVLLDYEQTTATSERSTLTANGPVVLKVHTHQNYDDTVTLENGFSQISWYESGPGITRINVTGFFNTVTGGGRLMIETPRSVEIADTDSYPSVGSVKVVGLGSMVLTALSTTSVQIDLDADGDDSYELRQTQTWDWLY
jgi:hypothetical protein